MNCEFCFKLIRIKDVVDGGVIEHVHSDIKENCDLMGVDICASITEDIRDFPHTLIVCGECMGKMGMSGDDSVPCPFCLLPIIDPKKNICSKCMVKNI